MYNCEILADSLSPHGCRLTTMKITFPRFILAEMNTHRMFSRNSASSRAIPFRKMVEMVEKNPFIPIAWQKDHKGMQGTKYFDELDSQNCIREWKYSIEESINAAKQLHDLGVTKQLCNRLLEPFMWHTVIVTATEWENFFKLRCPEYVTKDGSFKSKIDAVTASIMSDNEIASKYPLTGNDLNWLQLNKSQAEIHIQAIAELMWDAYNKSTPKELKAGEWHIPFGDNIDTKELAKICKKLKIPILKWEDGEQVKAWIATARCARISYETLGDDPKIDYAADIKLHDRLVKMQHMSPMEHCARVMTKEEYWHYFIADPEKTGQYGWCRNFRGFIQYRHLIETQNDN